MIRRHQRNTVPLINLCSCLLGILLPCCSYKNPSRTAISVVRSHRCYELLIMQIVINYHKCLCSSIWSKHLAQRILKEKWQMGIILSAKLNSLNLKKNEMTLHDRFLELIQWCFLKYSQPNFISLLCFRAYH